MEAGDFSANPPMANTEHGLRMYIEDAFVEKVRQELEWLTEAPVSCSLTQVERESGPKGYVKISYQNQFIRVNIVMDVIDRFVSFDVTSVSGVHKGRRFSGSLLFAQSPGAMRSDTVVVLNEPWPVSDSSGADSSVRSIKAISRGLHAYERSLLIGNDEVFGEFAKRQDIITDDYNRRMGVN